MLLATRSLAALCLALAVPAQTFLVDAASGPGTNFTDLPPAIAAVPDGAILLVRPGSYGPIALNGKGLSILATAPGVVLAPGGTSIHVQNLSASQAFTLRGVRAQLGSVFVIALVLNCAGPVLFDGYEFTSNQTFSSVFSTGLRVQGSPQVVLRNCTIQARLALDAQSSAVTAESCELRGHDGFFVPHVGTYPGSGIQCSSSSIELSRCRVFGGAGVTMSTPLGPANTNPGPAILLYSSTARLSEDATSLYQAGQLTGGSPLAAIEGSQSAVVRSPQAVLFGSQGGAAVAASVSDTIRPLPSLRTITAPPGGTMVAEVTTPPGELVVLVFGAPMPPIAVPGFDGALWLDPTSVVLAAAGVPLAGQPLTTAAAVPPIASLVGQRFGWQALAWSPADGFRFGNPSIFAL
ncbi:MAG TPA: hypothetical protein VF384_05205 [Planctomycetota bacterium]